MKSRSKNLRRNRQASVRAVSMTAERLEDRRLLSTTLDATISNNQNSTPVEGALTVTVDPFGSFGESFPQSGALYDPFPFGNNNAYNSVEVSSLYFQPAGGFLTGGYVLPDQTAADAATNVQFLQSSAVNTAISTFDIDGFAITLTQTISPVPSTDSVTYLTQTYQITDVSNTAYLNTPFNVVHLLQAGRTDGSISNWGALSGDNRIGIAFTTKDENSVFQRIDALGVDSSGNTVYDWDTTNSPVGFDITNEAATSSNDPGYYQTIVANSGIPASDNGNVDGETNGDLIDDTTPPAGQREEAIIAVQDSLEFTSLGQQITYITRTGWGDTGSETPTVYHQPGTFNISSVTTSAPEGTNAVLQITRTDGSLGHASVNMNDTNWLGTATPGAPDDPNADFQAIVDDASNAGDGILPPVNVILADGQTTTGAGSYTADPTIPVFNDIKIEPSEFFFAQIDNPQDGAKLANGDDPTSPPTLTQVSIPANDNPAPFHFATTDPVTDQPVTTQWTEGQSASIAVMRNADDGGNPNSGPYGTFTVQYTITGSGTNPATPSVDFVDNTPGATYDAATNSYTGSLTFPAVDSEADADQNQYQYINLQMLTDNLYEGPENFTITLQDANPLLITTPSTFTGTILDAQSSGPVHLEFDSQSIDESAGAQTINVIRSGSTDGQVTIGYTIAGSGDNPAVPGTDFTIPGLTPNNGAYSGTLTFDVGSSTPENPLVLDMIATDMAAANKTFTITLTNPSSISGLLGNPSTENVTITNENTPGVVHFVGSSTETVTEGADPITGAEYKTIQLQVTRDPDQGSEGSVSVNYFTADGTAKAGSDYQAASGTLTWAAGQTGPQTIDIEVYNNTSEPYPRTDKNFTVSLTTNGLTSAQTGGVAIGSPDSVNVTITNNQQPGINLSDSSYTVYEKDPATGLPDTAQIVVERDLTATELEGAPQPWSFTYALTPSTGLAGVDYTAPTTTTINVPASQSTYTISIPILADDNNVNDTSFFVRLTSGTIGTSPALGNDTTATVNITNADTDVAVANSTYTATPGSGVLPITINRTGRSDEAIVVTYTTADGTATAGTDYTATSGSITLAAGQTSATVNVPILTPVNSNNPTRTFSFKITGVSLADPTQANTYTLNYSSTPSTVSIAGLVTATSIQLQSGKPGQINRVVVTFSDPLSAATASNTYNYVLTTTGKKGGFSSQVVLTNATYDAATNSVTLFTKKNLSNNKLYQLSIRTDGGLVSTSNEPFVTGAPGGLGGTQVATFATGSKIKYSDPDGDIVTLQMKHGGTFQFIDGINGGYPSLVLAGTAKSQLTGTLKQVGDGHTIIESITNPDGVQDLLLTNPLFTVE